MDFEQSYSYVDAQYHFGEWVRWNLFFTSPTLAAVFASALLPYFWINRVQAKRNWRLCLQAGGELILWFILLKTYSRGAFISTMIAYIFYEAVRWHRGEEVFTRDNLLLVSGRAALVAALALAVGWVARVDPSFIARDQSVLNRLPIWSSGLKMIAASPVHGWGSDNAGVCYSEWFQSENNNSVFRGLVSTPLDIAVEQGLPTLILFLTAVGTVIVFAIKGRRSSLDLLLLRAAASLLAALFAAQFVSIGPVSSLYIVPVLSFGVALVAMRRAGVRQSIAYIAVAGCGATLVAAFIFGAGMFLAQSDELIFRPFDRDWVSITRRSKEGGPIRLALMPTRLTNGNRYGFLADLILSKNPGIGELLLSRDENITVAALERIHCPNVVAFGDAISGFPSSAAFRRVVYHPSDMPPQNLCPEGTTVVLPRFDDVGTLRSWEKWAANNRVPLLRSTDMTNRTTPEATAEALSRCISFWKEIP